MKVLSIEFTVNHIYIYEQNCGKNEVTVEKKYKLDMPPNTYYNRVLINNDRRISDVIKNCIAENKIKAKKVILTTSNIDCMVENMTILNGNKKQLDGMVEQELRKRHKLNADYLYDYVVLGPDPIKKGFLKVKVTMCVKALIQNAYDIIKKAGLIPYKIVFADHVMEEMANLYQLTDASENSIIACINQDEAHYLYVGHGQEPYYRYGKLKTEQKAEDNLFILSNINQRQDEEDEAEELEINVAGDLTRMLRFHSQRNPGKDVAGIYLYGCYDKMNNIATYLENSLNIPIKHIALQKDFSNIQYELDEDEAVYSGIVATIAALWDKEERYDFFDRLEEVRNGKQDKLLFLPTIISLAAFVVILLVSVYNYNEAKRQDQRAQEIANMLAGKEMQQAYEEKNLMIETCNTYTRYNHQVTEAIGFLETMPRFTSDMFRNVDRQKPEGTIVTSYSFGGGTLKLGCYASDQYAPAEYARILQESGDYKEVTYSGFSKTRDSLGNERYTFVITIKMW